MFKNQAGKILINSLITAGLFSLVGFGFTDNFSEIFSETRNARRAADIHQVQLALELYYGDNGRYPQTQNYQPTVFGWQQLMAGLTSADDSGPWLAYAVADPAPEKNISYQYSSTGQNFEIWYYLETNNGLKKEILTGF